MKKYRDLSPEITDFIDIGYFSFEENISSPILHINWASLRSEKTFHEFNQILLFVQDTQLFGQKNRYMCDKIQDLLFRLEGGQRDAIYMKVLLIVTKYLDGIKRFLSKNIMIGLSSYQQLFEGVFIAIIHETHAMKIELN